MYKKMFAGLARYFKKKIYAGFVISFLLMAVITVFNLTWNTGNPIGTYHQNISCESGIIHSNPSLCQNVTKDGAILYIYTQYQNIGIRNTIRFTYASDSVLHQYNVRRLFVMGVPSQNIEQDNHKEVRKEIEKHNDLLIGNFTDSYRDLCCKGLGALSFIQDNCQGARWILKADDDTLLDLSIILPLLRNTYSHVTHAMFGLPVRHVYPVYCDKSKAKWCIPRYIYPSGQYPDYMAGMGYVITADLLPYMLKKVDIIPYFPVDDVYMTGILTSDIPGVTLISWEQRISAYNCEGFQPGKTYVAHCKSQYKIMQAWAKVTKLKTKLEIEETHQVPYNVLSIIIFLCTPVLTILAFCLVITFNLPLSQSKL